MQINSFSCTLLPALLSAALLARYGGWLWKGEGKQDQTYHSEQSKAVRHVVLRALTEQLVCPPSKANEIFSLFHP